MDVDICDILADVSRPPPSSFNTLDTDASTDHQLLTRAWTSERCTPSLLPYPTDLMTRVLSRIQAQILRIEDLASSEGDPSYYSATNGTSRQTSSQNSNLILAILQTDLSRTQFLVRSLLRQRLAKLTSHAAYYLAQHVKSEDRRPGQAILLSDSEVAFVRHHQALLTDLYENSFLNAFPQGLRRLDDSSGGVKMVEGPEGRKVVFVRCLKEGGWGNERDVDEAVEDRGGSGDEGASVLVRMGRGEIWVVRWRDVKGGVERGEVEVL